MKVTFNASSYTTVFKKAYEAVRERLGRDPKLILEIVIRIAKSKRSIAQNNLMHALLNQVSKQCKFTFIENSRPTYCFGTTEEVKRIFAGSLDNSVKMAIGLNGEQIIISPSTRDMSVKKMSLMIELIYQFGAENEIKWDDKVNGYYEELEKLNSKRT